jgi:flagellin-specific chaperone FliS
MNRPEHLPRELSKEHLKWLRIYGYCLNVDDETYNKVRHNLKKWYTYEYYFYVDIDLRKEAKKIFEGEDYTTKEFRKSWKKRFSHEKKRLIKQLYGLEKKEIR